MQFCVLWSLIIVIEYTAITTSDGEEPSWRIRLAAVTHFDDLQNLYLQLQEQNVGEFAIYLKIYSADGIIWFTSIAHFTYRITETDSPNAAVSECRLGY